jgi:nucleotide-binding universal stress UspA family protein
MPDYDSILVAVDGSERARAAARQAIRLAGVFDDSVVGVDVAGEQSLSTPTEAAVEDLESLATEVPCETTVERGRPHEVIESMADRVDADLVAVGSHGRDGLRGYLFGNVAEHVVRTTPAPVLAVPS